MVIDERTATIVREKGAAKRNVAKRKVAPLVVSSSLHRPP